MVTFILAVIAIEIAVALIALAGNGDDKWKEETRFRADLLRWHDVANKRAIERNAALERIALVLERRMQA